MDEQHQGNHGPHLRDLLAASSSRTTPFVSSTTEETEEVTFPTRAALPLLAHHFTLEALRWVLETTSLKHLRRKEPLSLATPLDATWSTRQPCLESRARYSRAGCKCSFLNLLLSTLLRS